jgi:ribosomal protein S18 acetylase RimI-like enzyme
MEVSEASVADAEDLSVLSIKTYVDAFGDGFTPEDLASYLEQTLTAERWVDYLSRDRVLLARIDGHAVGYVQFGPGKQSHSADIRRLYVEAARHGQGIGSALLRAALAEPEVRAAAVVTIDVWAKNTGALRLYERFGFHHEGELKPFVLNGVVEDYDLILVRRPAATA